VYGRNGSNTRAYQVARCCKGTAATTNGTQVAGMTGMTDANSDDDAFCVAGGFFFLYVVHNSAVCSILIIVVEGLQLSSKR